MNKLILTGRPTTDPEIIYTEEEEKQKILAKFRLASNRIFVREGEATADFIPCIAFGKQAKLIEEYVKKGSRILVTGPIRNNDYTNKHGEKIYGFQMTIETIEFLEKKKSSANGEEFMNLSEEELADMPFN